MKTLDYLPHFYRKDKESVNYKILSEIESQINELEGEIDNLKNFIHVSTTSGKGIDDLGKMFKLYRFIEENDETFRLRILNFWKTHKTGGTKKELTDVIEYYDGTVNSYEEGDASIRIDFSLPFIYSNVVKNSLMNIKAAGVVIWLSFNPLSSEEEKVKVVDEDLTTIQVDVMHDYLAVEHSFMKILA